MRTFWKVLYISACCIMCVTGHPTVQLTVTSRGRSVESRPEVSTKQDGLDAVQFNIPEEVIERMLPYEAEEAIVTRERMDVSKWGQDLPKIKTDRENKKHEKSTTETKSIKRRRKGKRFKDSKSLQYAKVKHGHGKRGHRHRDLKKRNKKFREKSVN
ncbi:uncharacterized protein LOC121380700 [Gigantopelta aegis]|uniref:uncharacterized protein LOC121380700 n=1 Tax=Gigantopelta aegis TaxID=1735272 RepID=UPI001B88AE28|nr:uncharacterized protein LOC121380700 [Gigantopelta aegis]